MQSLQLVILTLARTKCYAVLILQNSLEGKKKKGGRGGNKKMYIYSMLEILQSSELKLFPDFFYNGQ